MIPRTSLTEEKLVKCLIILLERSDIPVAVKSEALLLLARLPTKLVLKHGKHTSDGTSLSIGRLQELV